MTENIKDLRNMSPTLLRIVIKQNKKSQLDSFNYDFSKVVTLSDDRLYTQFIDNPEYFDEFLVEYYARAINFKDVRYEIA